MDRELLAEDDDDSEAVETDSDNDVEAHFIKADQPTEDEEVEGQDDDTTPVRVKGSTKGNRLSEREQEYKLCKPRHKQKYNVLVCDEAHLLKSHKSDIHKAVKCFDRTYFLAVTATPMLNNTLDILALLLLLMPKTTATYTPAGYSYHTMYGDGEGLGLCDPTKDPRDSGFLTGGRDTDELMRVLQAAKGPSFNTNHPEIRNYVSVPGIEKSDKIDYQLPMLRETDLEYAEKLASWQQGRKWWQLQPCNVRWASREFGQDFDGTRILLRPIFEQICVKRGMQTPLTLPNGKAVRPGDDLKGACFRVVNLQFRFEDQLTYNASWNQCGKHLYSMERPNQARQDTSRGTDFQQRGGGANHVEDGQARINTRAVRHLLMPAFNVINNKLLEPRMNTAGLVNALESASLTRQQDLRQSKLRALQKSTPSQQAGKNTGAEMGVEEVLSLIKSHPNDGGANWVFEVLKDSGRYESISSRSQYIQFHAWSSPILCALILQIHEWIQEPMGKDRLPNRVVVIAKMPWIQQEVSLCLEMFGWKVASIGSDHSVAERNAYIDQFNDPDTDIQILLTSMDLSAYGLNLHKACCKGIIVQWPWNANHLLQILGRLPRIGQKRVVEWVIFHMSGTIYDKMQTIIWSKYIKQLAVESKIPKDVHGVWANIAAHGVIHRLFNLPFNRWLWDKTAFQLDVVGYDGKLRRNENLAVFFERVAALLNDNTRTPPIDQPGEMLAWKELQSAGRNDLIAGAYAWMDRRENDGEEPTVTFAWLRDYCVYDNLAKLSNATKAVYLSDEVADQLERDPQFPLMPMESEVPAYLAYMTERAKQDLLVAERAALKRGAPEHDAMGSNTDNDVDSPSQSPSRRALRHKAKRARLAREQALDDEE